MIIAELINKSELPKIPRHIKAMHPAYNDVMVEEYGLEEDCKGAKCWLLTKGVVPHRDTGWYNKFFLTLVVRANGHNIGDAKSTEEENRLKAGQFLIIDPRVTHWLTNVSAKRNQFISIQWEIPRKNACRQIAKVLKQFKTEVSPKLEKRYAKFVNALLS